MFGPGSDPAVEQAGELLDAKPKPDDQAESEQPKPESESEFINSHEREWDEAVQQASQIAKSQGHASGNKMMNIFGESHHEPADWRTLLQRYLLDTAKQDYSWGRPNRRFIDSGLYLPSMHSEGIGELTLAVDTSGSINKRELQSFWNEIKACADLIKPSSVRVIQCDRKVNSDERYDALDLPDELQVYGGGGTAYAPVFHHINNDERRPHVVVYFTDGECNDSVREPDYPVIWAVSDEATEYVFGKRSAQFTVNKFGDVIRLGQ